MVARRASVKIGAALGAAALVLAACQEQQVGPTAQDFARERAALAEKVREEKAKTAKRDARKAKKKRVARAQTAAESSPAFGAVDASFRYDETGKRDPFRSSEWDRVLAEEEAIRGPLEQFEVAQLSLLAVVWKTGNARALVQDPAGQSYIIREGTKIGKNEGRVVAIGDSLVVVEETYVDYQGQQTTKDIEMRIRRSQGG